MKNSILFLVLFAIPLLSFAGQGKDGGWPQSIQLLRIAKQNLLELLKQSSDQDIKDAINGMKDRTEKIKVEDVNLNLVIDLVNKLENPDVEQIEKSKYDGVRLFYYEEEPIRIYATKNFYNRERYQVQATDINAAILKEVQILILHEISHLWGFGEEVNEVNYARTFASRLVNILHGSLKVNFTQKEKMESLSKAYLFESIDIRTHNSEKFLDDKDYSCLTVDANSDKTSNIHLSLDLYQHNSDGYIFQKDDQSILRWTIDGYLMVETSYFSFGSNGIKSHFMKKKGVNRNASEYTICHNDEKKLANLSDRLIRPYYTRSNLLTDYDNSSLVVFQSILIQDVSYLSDSFKSMTSVMTANQKQIINNIDYKIKVQLKDVYERLISHKYKYSKDQDNADMEKINNVINSGMSTEGKAIWAQVAAKVSSLNSQIIAMKNYSRQLTMDSFYKDFIKSFNAIADKTQEFEDEIKYHSFSCGKYKRVGDYYACNIEINKSDAEARIKFYENLNVEMDALAKRFINRANATRD